MCVIMGTTATGSESCPSLFSCVVFCVCVCVRVHRAAYLSSQSECFLSVTSRCWFYMMNWPQNLRQGRAVVIKMFTPHRPKIPTVPDSKVKVLTPDLWPGVQEPYGPQINQSCRIPAPYLHFVVIKELNKPQSDSPGRASAPLAR